MNIGSLFQFKKYFWFLYPSKDIASAAAAVATDAKIALAAVAAARAVDGAAYYSNRFNCNVSYIKPNSVFCLLEKDGEFIKVLTTNGELGWIIVDDWCKDDIEEVNQ